MPGTKTQTRRRTAATKAHEPRVRALRRRYNLPQSEFRRLLSVSVRTLAKLELDEDTELREPIVRRVTEAERLHHALAKLIKPSAIGPWMRKPNPAFGNLKPIELIERGQSDQLWAMIYDLRSGNPA